MALRYKEACLGQALKVSILPSSSIRQSISDPSLTVRSSTTAKYTRLIHALSEAFRSTLARVLRSLPRYGEVYSLTGASVAMISEPSGRFAGGWTALKFSVASQKYHGFFRDSYAAPSHALIRMSLIFWMVAL